MIQVYIERTGAELRRDLGKVKAIVKTAILEGDPADRILDYARKQKASLIITVSHGHSGILPWTMGSTAYRIVHGAVVSVLLVRASKNKKKGGPAGIFGRVLLPLDGSAASEQALPYGLEIAKKLKSQLTILSVVEPGPVASRQLACAPSSRNVSSTLLPNVVDPVTVQLVGRPAESTCTVSAIVGPRPLFL